MRKAPHFDTLVSKGKKEGLVSKGKKEGESGGGAQPGSILARGQAQ